MAAKPIRRRLMNLEGKGMASKFGQNELIMKLCTSAIVCFLGVILSGCSYSTTAHQFEFYGSTQESFGRDFFYVKYGATGSATATYTVRGGGFVREGLIADAKRDLIASHPLGPNQSYVNMSVDITQTQTGGAFGESVYVSKIDLTATVSADVIEFGQPPVGYQLPTVQAKSLTSPLGDVQSSSELPESEDLAAFFSVGDSVEVRYNKEWVLGVVKNVDANPPYVEYTVEISVGDKTRLRYFSENRVRQPSE